VLCSVGYISNAAPLSESESESRSQFVKFVAEYGKSYPIQAVFQRFAAFKFSLALIDKHNAGNSTWRMGINQFADLRPEEFKALHLSNVVLPVETPALSTLESQSSVLRVFAEDIDWRTKGAVTPVKTQGACGSGWAFAATGAIEAYWKLKTGNLLSMSEQQLVDCAGSSGNAGCFGGTSSNAMTWISKNDGICFGKDYPYTALMGVCQMTCKPEVKLAGVQKNRGEPALVKAIAQLPVAVGIDASNIQLYKSGVFSGPCTQLMNQGVLVVGGVSSGPTQPYWLVKNSYGPQWGMNGYILMEQGLNLCGMANELAWPT